MTSDSESAPSSQSDDPSSSDDCSWRQKSPASSGTSAQQNNSPSRRQSAPRAAAAATASRPAKRPLGESSAAVQPADDAAGSSGGTKRRKAPPGGDAAAAPAPKPAAAKKLTPAAEKRAAVAALGRTRFVRALMTVEFAILQGEADRQLDPFRAEVRAACGGARNSTPGLLMVADPTRPGGGGGGGGSPVKAGKAHLVDGARLGCYYEHATETVINGPTSAGPKTGPCVGGGDCGYPCFNTNHAGEVTSRFSVFPLMGSSRRVHLSVDFVCTVRLQGEDDGHTQLKAALEAFAGPGGEVGEFKVKAPQGPQMSGRRKFGVVEGGWTSCKFVRRT